MVLPPKSATWSYRKLFGDNDGFMAAGLVCIHPYGEKPLKNVKDNAYVRAIAFLFYEAVHLISPQVFFVIEGVVEVRIHKSSYKVPSGGSFMVPRGQTKLYSLSGLPL